MEKIVKLNWKNLDLGTLYLDENLYIFLPNYENKEEAKKSNCPVDYIFYSDEEKYISKEIFYFFKDFIFEDTRDDLKEYVSLYNIKGENKDIVKLKTVAKLKQDKNRFWIE